MTKYKKITAIIKNQIIEYRNSGIALRKISEILGIGYGTVQRALSKNDSHITNLKTGPKPKITKPLKRIILRKITSGEIDTAVDICKMIKTNNEANLSPQAVRNMLKSAGLKSAIKSKKPLLTRHHKRLRYEFAKKYESWTIDDWKRVVFSDETKVNRIGSDGKKWVWKKPEFGIQDSHISKTVKHGGGSLMVWGCFSAFGTGNLVKIEGNMNAQLYIEILTKDFLGSLECHCVDKSEVVFQHDNDPKHTAKITKKWLDNQGISVLDWPPQSPDMNPIENMWAWFKIRISQYDDDPKSIHELWGRVQDVWNRFSQEECLKLIESMPERIAALKLAKGGYTKF